MRAMGTASQDEVTGIAAETPSVKSVQVAVQILEALTDMPGPQRVTELARTLGMTKARVSRHLQTLTMLGLVERAREGDGYTFGRKLLKFGRAAVYRSNIVEVARPVVTALGKQTGHTALLTTPTKGGAIVVYAAPNPHEPGIMVHPGMVFTLPASPAARLFYFFENKKPLPPRVRENMAQYGVDFEADPYGSGLGGIAAPIFEPEGTIASAVGVVLSSALMTPEPPLELIKTVKAAAGEIQDYYAEGARPAFTP